MKLLLTMPCSWSTLRPAPSGVTEDGRFGMLVKLKLTMKIIPALAVLTALAPGQWFGASRLFAAEQEGVALAIIYDTSGSMRETVRDTNGKPTPKYLIANRALAAIATQIQTFATNNSALAPRRIDAGLFIFAANSAREAIKFGPFDPDSFRDWARDYS